MNPNYTIEILDSTLTPVAAVRALAPLAHGDYLSYSTKLSDYGVAKFRVATKDPMFDTYGDVLKPYANHVRISRKGTVVWQGVIIDCPSRNKNFIEVHAYTYEFLLTKVLVIHDIPDGNGADNYRTFKSGTMADAVTALLNEVKTYVGANSPLANLQVGTIENPVFPANFTDPTNTSVSLAGQPWTFSTNLPLKFDYKDVLYVLQSFGIYSTADFQITAKPFVKSTTSVVSTNYVPNPSFEVDTASWAGDADHSGNFGIIGRTTGGLFGTYCGYVQNYQGLGGGTITGTLPAGTYTVSFYAKGSGTQVIFTTANGLSYNIFPTSTWQRYSYVVTLSAPSAIGLDFLPVGVDNAVTLDGVMVTPTAIIQTYFDGSTASNVVNGTTYTNSWTGTAHNSPSNRTISGQTTLSTNLVLDFKAFIGNKQPQLEFTYGPTGAIEDYDVPLDGKGMVNDITGIAADNNFIILKLSLPDTASVNKYGKVQGVSAFADAKNINALRARLTEELFLTATPDSEIHATLNDKAYPLGQYGLGDTVTFRIKDHVIDVNAVRRIVGIDVSVKQSGKETITLVTNVPRNP